MYVDWLIQGRAKSIRDGGTRTISNRYVVCIPREEVPEILQLEAQLRRRKGRKPHTTHLEQWLQRTLEIAPLLSGTPSRSHKVEIPPFRVPSMSISASSSGTESAEPRKRGRPRKHPLPASTSSAAPPSTGSSSSSKKRSHADDGSNASKQLRSSSYVSSASASTSFGTTSYLTFPYDSRSLTVDPTLALC